MHHAYNLSKIEQYPIGAQGISYDIVIYDSWIGVFHGKTTHTHKKSNSNETTKIGIQLYAIYLIHVLTEKPYLQ